ncbi:hypothetical protein LSAT2_014432 [Lamellibrachia satsuma]|nr:hypothetical protein LSAT2_014432 [Lamellibrachia satsuma]
MPSDMPPPPPPSPSPPPTKAPSYVHFSGESPTACPSGKWRDSRGTSPLSPADTVHSERLSQTGGASYDLVATGASGSSNVVVAPIRDQPYRASGLRTATISIGRPRDPLATTTRNGYGTLNRHREPGSSPKYGYSPTYFQSASRCDVLLCFTTKHPAAAGVSCVVRSLEPRLLINRNWVREEGRMGERKEGRKG